MQITADRNKAGELSCDSFYIKRHYQGMHLSGEGAFFMLPDFHTTIIQNNGTRGSYENKPSCQTAAP